jgi:NTP pyrophosphatase (non-canonical NTP hydrolase)
MDFKKYQKESRKTAEYQGKDKSYVYPLMGLAGETGEVIEKIKHVFRDKNNKFDADSRKEIAKEMGDVLWYLAQLATELGISIDQVAEDNIIKLQSRQKRGKILGRGDNR